MQTQTTIINFPTKRVEHDHCPECGNRNGAFERLGSGICNACLDKRSAAARAAEKQATAVRRVSRCQVCKQHEIEWTMQPYGPDDAVTFTVPGSHYRGFVAIGVCDACRQRVQSGQTVTFTYKQHTCTLNADAPISEPEPTPEPTTRRQSREGQRNARAELAYQGIRDMGSIDPRNSALEVFSVPSLSEPGVRRTVAHDMASDRYHCDCTHGQYGGRGECYHMLAARRRVDERRAQWQAAYERDQRTSSGYNDTLNLMYGVQPTSEW